MKTVIHRYKPQRFHVSLQGVTPQQVQALAFVIEQGLQSIEASYTYSDFKKAGFHPEYWKRKFATVTGIAQDLREASK